MKILFSYSRKWLFYIVSFLLLFTVVLLVSEYRHEKNFRIEALNTELDNYYSAGKQLCQALQYDFNRELLPGWIP